MIVTLFAVLLFIIFLLFMENRQSSQKNPVIYQTPTLVQQQFSYVNGQLRGRTQDNKAAYVVVVPTDLSLINDQYTVRTFTFSEGGKVYNFKVSPPGDQNVEFGDRNVSTVARDEVYGGKRFKVVTWSENGRPFLIHATDVEQGPFYLYDFSIELPPSSTSKYIDMFNRILTTFQISS